MSVGKSSITRAAGKKEAVKETVIAAPAEETEAVVKEPAKKAAPKKAPRHGNYVLITEELPVWLL
ncbi:MAG: hypothetical protein IKS35_01345 [Clostridia bacterium]|nr:hypothetical protein [Clostridia bacterium]